MISAAGVPLKCAVTTNKGSTKASDCKKVPGAKLFEFTDAIPAGYGGEVVIKGEFKNPVDNWGAVGFKIKTYEIVKTGSLSTKYLVDKLEEDVLIPNL
jgi:hypothetical protein